MSGKQATLRVATCQFAESFQPHRNGAVIRRYIAAAAKQKADVVHFHEGALSGYGLEVASADYDWDALRDATESILEEAAKRQVWVILGSSHRLTGPNKPHNSLYVISPAGKVVDRYDKRFCTGRDMEIYSPGDHFVTFKINGIKCGLLICYDSRFPEMFREHCRLAVRVMFHSFHNSRAPRRGILTDIMRPTIQAHAGTNAMWISAPNSSAYYSLWPSVFVTPDGRIAGHVAQHRAGLMVNTVDTGKDYYDASAPHRGLALRGVLQSGKCPKDPRSANRKCY